MGKRGIFSPTVIRLMSGGTVAIMNHKDKGMRSHGVEYTTLTALLEEWDVILGGHGADEHGPYIDATPGPRGQS